MMKKDDEVESIAQSANAIAMLHKNLAIYLNDSNFQKEKFSIKKVIDEQVNFSTLSMIISLGILI